MANLENELNNLLGAEQAKKVLDLVKATDPMTKYRATDKGKAARKRANQKYYVRKKVEKGTPEDVASFLELWCQERIDENKAMRAMDDPTLWALSEAERSVEITASALWHAYTKENYGPAMTRKRFVSLLPDQNCQEISSWKDAEGKKHYTPALKIDFVPIGWPKQDVVQ